MTTSKKTTAKNNNSKNYKRNKADDCDIKEDPQQVQKKVEKKRKLSDEKYISPTKTTKPQGNKVIAAVQCLTKIGPQGVPV